MTKLVPMGCSVIQNYLQAQKNDSNRVQLNVMQHGGQIQNACDYRYFQFTKLVNE